MPEFEVNSYITPDVTPSHIQRVLRQVPSEAVLKRLVRSWGLGMRWDVEPGREAAPDPEMYLVVREQLWFQWVMWGSTGQIQPLPTGPP